MSSLGSRLCYHPVSWAGTVLLLKVGGKETNTARLGYSLVNFVPQRTNTWRGREGVKIIQMEIPKVKLLRLPFSRKPFILQRVWEVFWLLLFLLYFSSRGENRTDNNCWHFLVFSKLLEGSNSPVPLAFRPNGVCVNLRWPISISSLLYT